MHGRSSRNEEVPLSFDYSSWCDGLNFKIGITANILRFYRTTFQELLVISVLSIFTALVDYTYFTLLRKEGEDDTVPIGFPFAVILGVVFIKFVLETTAVKAFCTYFGLTYMSSSSPRRITIKLILMSLLAIFKYLAPFFEAPDRRKEREDYVSKNGSYSGLVDWRNLLNMYGLIQGMMLAHVGMIAFLRTYIDSGIYSYKLLTYKAKDEAEVLEAAEKKEDETRRSTPKELNNNSYLNFRPTHERGMPARAS